MSSRSRIEPNEPLTEIGAPLTISFSAALPAIPYLASIVIAMPSIVRLAFFMPIPSMPALISNLPSPEMVIIDESKNSSAFLEAVILQLPTITMFTLVFASSPSITNA